MFLPRLALRGARFAFIAHHSHFINTFFYMAWISQILISNCHYFVSHRLPFAFILCCLGGTRHTAKVGK